MAVSDFFMPNQDKGEAMPITEDERARRLADRISLFETASDLLAPIITEHGIESYRGGGVSVLVPGPTPMDHSGSSTVRPCEPQSQSA